MDLESMRRYCMSLPHTTETVQWENNLVFKIASKMYAVAALEPGPHWLSFKTSPEDFASLTERDGINPAPYLARAQWVAIESPNTLPAAELKPLLRQAYRLVIAKLPKKTQAALR